MAVLVGQIYRDTDPRMGNRRVRVVGFQVIGSQAESRVMVLLQDIGGRRTKVRIARMTPGPRGGKPAFELVDDMGGTSTTARFASQTGPMSYDTSSRRADDA